MDMTGSNGASNGHNLPLLRAGQDLARPGKTPARHIAPKGIIFMMEPGRD